MPVDPGLYFQLTTDELREVTRFALASAEEAVALLDAPVDPRIMAAIEAAKLFAAGDPRSKLQRVAAVEAQRAAKEMHATVASHAASAAGDAAASAYLHPFAKGDQVAHILRSSAHAALAAEAAAGDPAAAGTALTRARTRATPTLLAVLNRYPAFPRGRSRVKQLVSDLDLALREQ
ncbi:putative immunity protein [uncultured Serinicoccus sp.]|uniref:putative immunity protein n=1 Tax=uncultured Serinicoccus sp. TaxID=735514 RepID=UPI0026235AC6|nr:exonuclease SbcC [uncultured Serinicoccus sp.]